MQKYLFLSILTLLVFSFWAIRINTKHIQMPEKPFELYEMSKQYPHIGEGFDAYQRALKKVKANKTRAQNTPWDIEGPHNIGGRINCISILPGSNTHFFVGCADGGIFETTDAGNTWKAIFDDAQSLAVSDIAINPSLPNIMYAGTGDAVLSGYSHVGNGVYKTTDAGNTWQPIGLEKCGVISKILIDSNNTNIIYAAAMGNPFLQDSNRGLYKSTDAGLTWNKIFYVANNIGVSDLLICSNGTLYLTTQLRERSNTQSLLTSSLVKIHRSTDGGNTWTALSSGLPTGIQCKIGICVSNTNPYLLYANYIDDNYDFGGLYKTTDGGDTWSLVNTTSVIDMGGFGWYFGPIRLDPNNDNIIYILSVSLYKSTNGGVTFNQEFTTHSDKHDLKFINSSSLLLATDGGFYASNTAGINWTLKNNIPITQFYRVAYNPWEANQYFGGAQDNGTMYGSASMGLNTWSQYFGGDGFQPQFDATDPNICYAEWQNGNIVATDLLGLSYTNMTSSLSADRKSWNTPYFVSKHNNNHLYIGTYRIHKTSFGPIDAWNAISPDLTDGTQNGFHVVTTIDQSPINAQIIYAGTSDANVWVSKNDGASWNLINNTLPNRYVSSIKASPDNEDAVFCSFSGYRNYDTLAHLYYSTNNGSTWNSIATNLPNFPINDIWIRPGTHDSSIIIANDGGVYASITHGAFWYRVGSNMPIIPVYDIDYNPTTKKIFVGTFARSIQSMSIDSVFKAVYNVGLENEYLSKNHFQLFPNPCHHSFSIHESFIHAKATLQVYDIWGRLVKYYEANNSPTFNCSELARGIYMVKYSDTKNERIEKLTIE
ncbi:MAG: T9SS type A sorting domain-containing protein [Chitinophagaceae bacterium]